jgi:hypothetical protein
LIVPPFPNTTTGSTYLCRVIYLALKFVFKGLILLLHTVLESDLSGSIFILFQNHLVCERPVATSIRKPHAHANGPCQ